MKNLFTHRMFQVWRRPIPAGLWSGLIALVSIILTALAFPRGAYGPAQDLLMSLGGGFVAVYHLTIGLFIGGGRLIVVPLTALLWFGIGAILARYSKSGRAALGWWLAIYAVCVILMFVTLVFAQLL